MNNPAWPLTASVIIETAGFGRRQGAPRGLRAFQNGSPFRFDVQGRPGNFPAAKLHCRENKSIGNEY